MHHLALRGMFHLKSKSCKSSYSLKRITKFVTQFLQSKLTTTMSLHEVGKLIDEHWHSIVLELNKHS